jgi:ABC-type glycerol-3-phosphate transport system substrate-binding protein
MLRRIGQAVKNVPWLGYWTFSSGHGLLAGGAVLVLLIAIFVSLTLSGCSLFETGEAESSVTATVAIPTPGSTPTPEGTVEVQPTETIAPPPLITLNIWFVEEFSPQNDTPDGTILAEQLAAYDTGHLNLTFSVENKSPSGQGGTLSYLRTGRGVAPGVLPDLVVLPTDLLATAAAENLIYPLDELISQEMKDDLFPAAFYLSQVDGRMLGYPFALWNLTHMASGDDAFGETAPTTWDELLDADDAAFIFPGAGSPGAELVLQFYLASDGKLTDEAGLAILEVEPLANALTHFTTGRIRGLIPLQSSNMTTFEQSWDAFRNGSANAVQTDSDQFLGERGAGLESVASGLPGIEEPLIPLVKGWAYAISTPDPTRQAMAAELLSWLAEGSNLGEWSLSSMRLPARRTAFEQWPDEDDYIAFLGEELEGAEAFPNAAQNTVIDALGEALFDVLTLAKTPQAAAEDAAASLLQ